MSEHIDIVFDGPPGPVVGRFVEVRDDGFWVLRVVGPAYRIERNEQACASCRATLKDDHYNDCWWLVKIK